jgi:hypothetical protein
MKKYAVLISTMMFVLLLSFDVPAADEKGQEAKKESDSGVFIRYTPPMLGKPGKRVGGGTRGTPTEVLTLAALAPDHTGMASKPQPSLCWYISRPTDIRMEIVLDDGKSTKPVLETKLTKPDKGGVYCSTLSEYGIALKSAIEYQWFVTIIPDPDQRSKDIVTGGSVMFKEPNRDLTQRLPALKDLDLVRAYAENGYWYDAIETVMRLLKERPDDSGLLKIRSQLLEQVGLSRLAVASEKR